MISNIWLNSSELDISSESLPPRLLEIRNKNAEFTSEYDIFTYGSSKAHDFINLRFAPDVVWAYEKLNPPSYKADLLKYCILYTHGGWIIDPTLKILSPLPNIDGIDLFLFFRKDANGNFKIPVPGLIYAKPGIKLFIDLIDKVVSNVRHSFYGSNPWDPTGSGLISKLITTYYSSLVIGKGLFAPVTKSLPNRNLMYLDIEGNLIAWHKSGWSRGIMPVGDCSEINKQSINYIQAWNSRTIYNKDKD